jgi:hypothetical protein
MVIDYLRDWTRGKNVVAARNRLRQIHLAIAIPTNLAQDSSAIGGVFDRGRAIFMSTGSNGKPQAAQEQEQESARGCGVPDDCAKLPDKPMTAAQRRGLARKITAYLKRSGLACELVGARRNPPRSVH